MRRLRKNPVKHKLLLLKKPFSLNHVNPFLDYLYLLENWGRVINVFLKVTLQDQKLALSILSKSTLSCFCYYNSTKYIFSPSILQYPLSYYYLHLCTYYYSGLYVYDRIRLRKIKKIILKKIQINTSLLQVNVTLVLIFKSSSICWQKGRILLFIHLEIQDNFPCSASYHGWITLL